MDKMDKLDQAIAAFGDENSDLPIEDRLSGIRQALIWNAYEQMARVKKKGTSDPISDEEKYKQEECMKLFVVMEKMYNSEVKAAKAAGKSTDRTNAEMLNKIKEMTGSVGQINTKIPNGGQ